VHSSLGDIPSALYDRDAQLGLREPGIGRLSAIPIEECGEPLAYLPSLTGKRAIIRARLPWVRETVAQMVCVALSLLPPNLTLKISTGFRTIEMQRRGYNHYMRQLKRRHPTWPRAVLVRESNKFFHPVDAAAPPGHCTGAAVDVALCHRANGQLLDHVSTLHPVRNSWATFMPGLTERARRNRAALYQVMVESGFSNCRDEWWHYSYGDPGWAGRVGEPAAIYGLVTEYPPELVEEVRRTGKHTTRPASSPRLDRKR